MVLNLPILTAPPQARPGPPGAPAEVHREGVLRDSHGRIIRDLRLSITDRCNFRCLYCMEPDVRFVPQHSLLTTSELIRLARIGESLGIRKLRLTGGEPTLRPDLEAIISGIRRATQLELAMISNGSWTDGAAPSKWKRAGLERITVSIDSVDPRGFGAITRSTASASQVIEAIQSCLECGLSPLKINAVLLRGVNEQQALPLVELARRFGVEVRFIEYMPLDSAHAWQHDRFVPASETRRLIETRFGLTPNPRHEPSSTSFTFSFSDGHPGAVGFIAPVSSPFCGACSRLRITADGAVRPCLFSTTEWSLLPLLRDGASDALLRAFLIDAAWSKQKSHNIDTPAFIQPERPMSAIGG